MCGITGIAHWGGCPDAPALMKPMVASMRHRGPDGQGAWSCDDVALGHARLSILDHGGGGQPMTNEDGQVVVVFNGEIYNHRQLRKELLALGHDFKTDHSDTEVLVHGYESWGEELLPRLNGMFAFAIWDQRRRRLLLARDRYGIKPLYIAHGPENRVVFGSEVRAIFASGLIEKKASPQALLEYLSLQNYWGDETLFEGVHQLPAGHWEMIGPRGTTRRCYWDFNFSRSRRMNVADAAEEHRAILQDAIERQMDADVPVVTYLSGGIDSSAVTSCAMRLKRVPKAYTCIFDLKDVGEDRIVDERDFARDLARHMGIEQVELELPQDALTRSLDATVEALEYPRMGMAYVNYLIAQRVAADAKVVLSGTGGDELHGGYLYRYRGVPRAGDWRASLRRWARWMRGRDNPDAETAYRGMLNFPIAEPLLPTALTPEFLKQSAGFSPWERMQSRFRQCPSSDPWDLVMYVDAKTYLHGLLVLEDKLSMAHSLESRVPLLDNRLVDFILRVPWKLLCDGEVGKILFRESVKPFVPPQVYAKPKMGFGPPDASWYRGALRSWICEQLAEEKIRARGILQPEFVRNTLEDHFAGRRNNVAVIWSLLSLESWCRIHGMYGGNLDATVGKHTIAA